MTSRDPRSGWKRLEELLAAVKPGEIVTVEALASECGLPRKTVEAVLQAAATTELFDRLEDGRFERHGHIETTTFSATDRTATIVDGPAGHSGESPTPPPHRRKAKA